MYSVTQLNILIVLTKDKCVFLPFGKNARSVLHAYALWETMLRDCCLELRFSVRGFQSRTFYFTEANTMVCAIIGVCDTPRNTSRHLRRFLNDMIEKHNVDTFVINSFNDFSVVATWTLIDVKKKHPHIKLKLATTSHSDFWKAEEIKKNFKIMKFSVLSLLDMVVAAHECANVMISFSDAVAIYNSERLLRVAKLCGDDIYIINTDGSYRHVTESKHPT